ncbi:MAG TPA: tRNA (adenosine(37)-N6)-threonylcarbamoyltransferase complex ATPase subunit type 1 TsaE [Opitutaceae bacterium]|jgi:tRNA threonylcarbamoyladenosine biosynthesis protein TsaE|nr:tRNA (adenosine(37)-N6)-threonylcarbamoyltransferase complex ATPase subunit type 1 TsaE [Opitutaceae bacterium]
MNICDRLKAGVTTVSAEETRLLAAEWSAQLPADSTVALHGDLGVGKTTWVQGMAEGLGIKGHVTSPTFTIYVIHKGPGSMLAHLDAYRLGSEAEAEALLLEEYLVSPWCLAIEWPGRVPGWIPADAYHLDLGILPDARHTVRLR